MLKEIPLLFSGRAFTQRAGICSLRASRVIEALFFLSSLESGVNNTFMVELGLRAAFAASCEALSGIARYLRLE